MVDENEEEETEVMASEDTWVTPCPNTNDCDESLSLQMLQAQVQDKG